LGYNQKLRSASITDQGYVEEKSVVAAALYSSVASRGLPDTISRGTSHTKPRELTLDTKYEGVPLIGVWTGYAVMVVDKSGNRRVELGPKTIRLKWDETLEVLSLSTGKPKNTDTLERTVYLRTKNNKVSDVIDVETKDHVPLAIKLSFRVNFLEETNEKWFEVDNYVKLLCDHVRSMLKGMVRKQEVETFYSDGTAIVRDFLLGKSTEGERKGLAFPECGIVVEDVEVLAIEIKDGSVAQMLNDTQRKMVAANIRLNEAERDLTITRKSEEFTRQKANEAWKTKELILTLEIAKSQKESEVALSAIDAAIAQQQEELKNIEAQQAALNAKIAGELSREKSKQEQQLTFAERQAKSRLEELKAETESCVQRLQAAQSGFSEALLALGSQETLTKVFEAGSIQRYIGGDSVVDALKKVFAGTALEETISQHVGRLGNVSIPNPRK
jgi:major vault protein